MDDVDAYVEAHHASLDFEGSVVVYHQKDYLQLLCHHNLLKVGVEDPVEYRLC